MKNFKVIIATMALLAFAVVSHAASTTANATATYTTPVSVAEQSGFSFSMTRKAGAHFPAYTWPAGLVAWTDSYDKNPFDGQTPGCFKVTGDASQQVSVSVHMPTALTSGSLSIGIDATGAKKFEGAADATDCATAKTGTYATNLIDGTQPSTLPVGGNLYFAYRMSTLTEVSINSDNATTYTGQGSVDVDYL